MGSSLTCYFDDRFCCIRYYADSVVQYWSSTSLLCVCGSQGETGELARIWEELKTANLLNFQFSEKSSAYETAQTLARSLQMHPSVSGREGDHRTSIGSLSCHCPLTSMSWQEDVLSAGYFLEPFDKQLFDRFASLLEPRNMVTCLRSPVS